MYICEASPVTKTTATTSGMVGGLEQKASPPPSTQNGLYAQQHQTSAPPTAEAGKCIC